MTTYYNENTRVYYVVFKQGKKLISYLLRRNFSHIYVITRDSYNWIILDPHRLQMQILIPAVSIDADLPTLMTGIDDSVLRVEIYDRDTLKTFGFFGLLNCVTIVKYILGLRLYCLTPFSLYRRLLNFKAADLKTHGVKSVKRIK